MSDDQNLLRITQDHDLVMYVKIKVIKTESVNVKIYHSNLCIAKVQQYHLIINYYLKTDCIIPC